MAYQKASGQWADTVDYVAHASHAETVTGTTAAVEFGERRVARLKQTVSAVAGTSSPTLTTTVQTSSDGTTWYTSGAFTAATANGSEQKLFLLDRFVRLSYVISGTTPSFTFAVAGEVA